MNPERDVPRAPAPAQMPTQIVRDRRAGPEGKPISVWIETTTPILGGAPKTRSIDDVDLIRVPTIRGHLRFWWRALQPQSDMKSTDMYAAEARLWGKAAAENGGRSLVEISTTLADPKTLTDPKSIDKTDVALTAGDSYALWPARAQRVAGVETVPPVPRRFPGVRFQLSLRVGSDDPRDLQSVRDALQAWILFGGYGSRTRRGVGSLTAHDDRGNEQDWLPSADKQGDAKGSLSQSLKQLFGKDIFSGVSGATTFPQLSGATLLVGALEQNAENASHQALGWLQRFRQEPVGRIPRVARGLPPGQSRWPEPDKLRMLTNRRGHPPRYTDPTPAWPRADFGLPIVGRFHRDDPGDPKPFTITWHDGEMQRQRMASPVIVKALPTIQGYRPCVLWMSRLNPPGQVVAVDTGTNVLIRNSHAPFGFVGTAADDIEATKLTSPVAGQSSVKDAFLAWVLTQGAIQVTP